MYPNNGSNRPQRIKHNNGWFARSRDDGSGLIVCPWVRQWVDDPDLKTLSLQRMEWRWRSPTLKGGEGWAVIGASKQHALQKLREILESMV